MNYKLALQLKDTGFPQKEYLLIDADTISSMSQRGAGLAFQREGFGYHRTFDLSYLGYPDTEQDFFEHGKFRSSSLFSKRYLQSEEGKKFTVYFPTLSELIEACGDRFVILRNRGQVWLASNCTEIDDDQKCSIVSANSPEEAVAYLWLILNKK